MAAEKGKKQISLSTPQMVTELSRGSRYRCMIGMLASANTSQLSNHPSLGDCWPAQRHTCVHARQQLQGWFETIMDASRCSKCTSSTGTLPRGKTLLKWPGLNALMFSQEDSFWAAWPSSKLEKTLTAHACEKVWQRLFRHAAPQRAENSWTWQREQCSDLSRASIRLASGGNLHLVTDGISAPPEQSIAQNCEDPEAGPSALYSLEAKSNHLRSKYC